MYASRTYFYTPCSEVAIVFTNLEAWFERFYHICPFQKLFNPTFNILLYTGCRIFFVKFGVKYDL